MRPNTGDMLTAKLASFTGSEHVTKHSIADAGGSFPFVSVNFNHTSSRNMDSFKRLVEELTYLLAYLTS